MALGVKRTRANAFPITRKLSDVNVSKLVKTPTRVPSSNPKVRIGSLPSPHPRSAVSAAREVGCGQPWAIEGVHREGRDDVERLIRCQEIRNPEDEAKIAVIGLNGRWVRVACYPRVSKARARKNRIGCGPKPLIKGPFGLLYQPFPSPLLKRHSDHCCMPHVVPAIRQPVITLKPWALEEPAEETVIVWWITVARHRPQPWAGALPGNKALGVAFG